VPASGPVADRWETSLRELFSGVRKQATYIASDELREHIAVAIEEVRKL
jgi:hypothetical protein